MARPRPDHAEGLSGDRYAVAVAIALTVHLAAAFGISQLQESADDDDDEVIALVEFDEPPPPPPPPEPPLPEPPPPEPPPEPPKIAKEIEPPKKQPDVKPSRTPPPNPAQDTSDIAPGPNTNNDEAAPVVRIDDLMTGGEVKVPNAAADKTGTGGKGTNSGGGGPPTSTGTKPAPVSIASIKRRAMPIGQVDTVVAKLPAAAIANRVEGDIKVRLVVDENGDVVSRRLLNRLGHGLDQRALSRTKKLKFKPAIDQNDKPVRSVVVWTVTFKLPSS